MSRWRRQHTTFGPSCPSGEDHGPMLQLPSGRWYCPHSDHCRTTPEKPVARAATFTDAEAGL